MQAGMQWEVDAANFVTIISGCCANVVSLIVSCNGSLSEQGRCRGTAARKVSHG